MRFRNNLAAAQAEVGIKSVAAPKSSKQYDQFVISSLQSFAYAARTFNSLDPEAKARVFTDIPPASIHACNRCVSTLMRMLSKQAGDTKMLRRNSVGNTFGDFAEISRRGSGFVNKSAKLSLVGILLMLIVSPSCCCRKL